MVVVVTWKETCSHDTTWGRVCNKGKTTNI